MKPVDCLPILIKCGDIIYEYLRKHLTDEQISVFLKYLDSPGITYGQAFRYITQEHGQTETVFNAIDSLVRIRSMCDAAESPGQNALSPDRVFHVAFSALRTGLLIGMVADEEQRQALTVLSTHGKKFAESTGKHDDQLTHYLMSIFQGFHNLNGRYPSNKEVSAKLEKDQGNGFIHTVEYNGSVEWGENGLTGMKGLEKRLTKIRKRLSEKI